MGKHHIQVSIFFGRSVAPFAEIALPPGHTQKARQVAHSISLNVRLARVNEIRWLNCLFQAGPSGFEFRRTRRFCRNGRRSNFGRGAGTRITPGILPSAPAGPPSAFKFVPDKFVDPSGFEFRRTQCFRRMAAAATSEVVPAPGFEPGTY
jgi:hypothetical protein